MPFKKISKNKFKSPSGRKYTAKQVKFYHASKGTFKYGKGKKPKR